MKFNERLKYARERMALTLQQVESQTQIGVSSLSDFENEKREPKLSQLQLLARLYRREISFFFSQEPVQQDLVLWRKKPQSPHSEEIEATFLRLCSQYSRLETLLNDRVSCRLPCQMERSSPVAYRFADAERLACQVRDELKLGIRPAHSLLKVLEETCGLKIFIITFQPSGSAASTVSTEHGFAVLLNAGHSPARRNFDLAHELFHLLTWKIFRTEGDPSCVLAGEQEEKFANCFASHLLMPHEETKLAILEAAKNTSDANAPHGKAIGFEGIFAVARQFGVSGEALLWRLKEIFNADEEAIRDTVKRYSEWSSAWVSNEMEQSKPQNRPERFLALAIEALTSGKISLGRFAEYAGTTRQEAKRFLELGGRDAETVTLTTV